jgi:hypothetical protein
MERTEAFKKIMVMFKRGDITPKQLGSLMSQYYEKFIIAPTPSPAIDYVKVFDGKLEF